MPSVRCIVDNMNTLLLRLEFVLTFLLPLDFVVIQFCCEVQIFLCGLLVTGNTELA